MRSDLRVVAAGRGREGGTAPARGSSHGVNSSVRVETDGRGFSMLTLPRDIGRGIRISLPPMPREARNIAPEGRR